MAISAKLIKIVVVPHGMDALSSMLQLLIGTNDKIVWVRCLDENWHRPKADPEMCVYGTLNT